jgi:hypothetical protein
MQRDGQCLEDGARPGSFTAQGRYGSCRGKGRQAKILIIPNGTHRVARTLLVKERVGPWVDRESRDGVNTRLENGVMGNFR